MPFTPRPEDSMRTLIVTSYNRQLETQYAHGFLDTYQGELDTMLVSEDITQSRATHTVALRAHENFLRQNGWREVNTYLQDAVRFCHKPYAIWTAIESVYTPYEQDGYTGLLWIDADTVFHKPITEQFVQERLHTDGIMTYMGRPDYHSETGVLYFNIQNATTRDYVDTVIELYNTNEIYTLPETHDSYVWDWVRCRYQRGKSKRKQQFRDIGINERVPGKHIQAHLFGEYFDHLKGKRKQLGKSPENKHLT